jgi:aquaporin Z
MDAASQPAAARQAAGGRWREYLIEGWALGMFMLSAATVGVLLESPALGAPRALPDADFRRALAGGAMGTTAVLLMRSKWGRQSGAHMNPAVTLGFWMLGRVRLADLVGYVACQFAGGLVGVLLAAIMFGSWFTQAPVHYALTMPGVYGPWVAFGAEFGLSFMLFMAVLECSADPRTERYTPYLAGLLVAMFITFEAPLSGMSINPARSFASAAPAGDWTDLWLYFVAPPLGMLGAALLSRALRRRPGCAKLWHAADVRCIHCGFHPQAPNGVQR